MSFVQNFPLFAIILSLVCPFWVYLLRKGQNR